jgi:hypothetical protein
MRPDRDSSLAATEEVRDFVVSGGCAVCEGPMAVRATAGTVRGYCARCAWISRPLVWEANGRVAVGYPPLASA